MSRRSPLLVLAMIALAAAVTGCSSPYYADRGALYGGLGGAGVGALVGSAVGHTGAGAAIGAGVGALTGAAVGSGMDDIEARNRAQIAAQMQREVAAGAATVPDIVAMSQAGVAEELIVTHIQANGLAQPLQASDLIYLQQQHVSPRVVQAMQAPRQVAAAQPVVVQGPPPVIVHEPYYDPYGPYYYRPYYRRYPHYHPRTSVGVSFGH